MGETETATVDVFFRAWSRDRTRMRSEQNVRTVRVLVPASLLIDPVALLQHPAISPFTAARKHDVGAFEIQHDEGIWTRPDGRALQATDASLYRTWEQAEVEQEQEQAAGVEYFS